MDMIVVTRYAGFGWFCGLAIGCGGHSEATEPADTPSTATGANPGDECYVPEPRPIPARKCTSAILGCEAGSDTCLFTALSETVRPRLWQACGVYCGDLELGFRAGCITLVESRVDEIECVREQLLGIRYDCAPQDGMARVYLGDCTVR
jgi:hypothetical protein